jgi:DNA-binding transcriptional regulator YdaS (Cro superfamily)
MTTITRYEALCLAVSKAGTQEEFAEKIGVCQATVSNWVNRSKQLPAEYVLLTERLYGVSRHDLRPDIYPREYMTDQARGTRFIGVDHAAQRVAL